MTTNTNTTTDLKGMTLAEKRVAATDAGRHWAGKMADAFVLEVAKNSYKNDGLADAVDSNGMHIKVRAGHTADHWLAENRLRSSTLRDAFVAGFMAVYRSRSSELLARDPEHQAQMLAETFAYTVKRNLEGAEETLAKWAERLPIDPHYAFRWADDAMAAAAKLDATKKLKAIAEEKGVSRALLYAQQEALRGARFPSHSSSACSNAMHQFTTAAYAEFVELKQAYEVQAAQAEDEKAKGVL